MFFHHVKLETKRLEIEELSLNETGNCSAINFLSETIMFAYEKATSKA